MALDWRKETREGMDSRVAACREGFWERALPKSTPIISRQRIFSLIWRERFSWVGVLGGFGGRFWEKTLPKSTPRMLLLLKQAWCALQ